MNTISLRFRCPHCRARIKAPLPLSGRIRACPGCRHSLVVPALLKDAGPILVLLEQKDRYALDVINEPARNPFGRPELFRSSQSA